MPIGGLQEGNVSRWLLEGYRRAMLVGGYWRVTASIRFRVRVRVAASNRTG